MLLLIYMLFVFCEFLRFLPHLVLSPVYYLPLCLPIDGSLFSSLPPPSLLAFAPGLRSMRLQAQTQYDNSDIPIITVYESKQKEKTDHAL
jgi:hypothetical protein